MTFHGIIYDHDGTLIDSIGLVVEATNAALADAGFQPATREIVMRGMVLPTFERMGYHVRSDDRSLEARLAERFYSHAWRIGPAAARPYPGIATRLAGMRARGLRQAMLSNNQGGFIRRILAAHGLDGWLDPIFGEEDVPAPKPGGEGILAIAGLWGVAPSDVLLVGDSSADAGAAHAAGCPSVGVTWGTHSHADLATAGFDRLIDRPEDLPAALDSFC